MIYATRNQKGVEVFKAAEKTAMETMERARSEAQQKQRVKATGQQELFDAEVRYKSTRYDELRDRYLSKARQQLTERLIASHAAPYDSAWELTMRIPRVWESDLKAWIKEWKAADQMVVQGLKPKQQVPQINQNHVLIWRQSSPETSTH